MTAEQPSVVHDTVSDLSSLTLKWVMLSALRSVFALDEWKLFSAGFNSLSRAQLDSDFFVDGAEAKPPHSFGCVSVRAVL